MKVLSPFFYCLIINCRETLQQNKALSKKQIPKSKDP